MFRRIVVPLDGSPRARQTIPLAARIARASGGSVVLLSVLEPAIQVAWHTQLVPVQMENRMAERKGMAAERAQQVASEALRGVETTVEIAEGVPAPLILERAEERQADLIVLCSHGRTGLTRWALGSVAQKVACHIAIPVLLLQEGGDREQHIQEEMGEGGKLQITSSVLADLNVAGSLLAKAEHSQGRGSVEGSQRCDVLALATHGRSGPARWVVGSVTQRILNAARQPLLIVRPPTSQEKPR